MRPRHDARLVPAAAAAYVAAGTVLGGAVAPRVWFAVAVVLLAVAACTALPRLLTRGRATRPGVAVLGAVAVLVAVGLAAGGGVAAAADSARWSGGIDAALDGPEITVRGTVVREPVPLRIDPSRHRTLVRIHGWLEDGQRWHEADALVVAVGAGWADAEFGDGVVARLALRSSGADEPIGIAWEADLQSVEPAVGIAAAVARARSRLRDAAAELDDDVRGLVIGMAIGDTRQMPASQVQDMRDTSLAHLTAVSGAHFAVVAAVILVGLRRARVPRRVAAVALGLAMLAFAAVVLPEPSVMRAGGMALIVAMAMWWGRPAQPVPALAAAVLGLIVVDPWLALSFGFALSVAATAAIALWSPVLASVLETWLVPRLARLVSIPLSAQLACTPILILLDPGLGPYGVAANLLAVPFAIVVTVLGVAAIPLAAIHPALAGVPLAIASWAAHPIAWVADVFAAAPGARLPWPGGIEGAALAAACVLAAIVATSARRLRALVRLAAAVAVVGVVVASPPVREAAVAASAPPGWVVAVCDVGQGDMTLVRAGPRAAVVVDTGPRSADPARCLRAHGVSTVPLLVLTHPHADHDGGVTAVLGEADVGHAWVPPPAQAGAGERGGAARALTSAGVPVSTPTPGTAYRVGTATLEVWHLDAPVPAAPDSTHLNDSSLVLRASVDGVSALLLGDLETAGQRRLLAQGGFALGVDVVKVAHHGSATQEPALARAAGAAIALVSAGAENSFGHPAPETLELYRSTGAIVLRTDVCGDIAVAPGPPPVAHANCGQPMAGLAHGRTEDEHRPQLGVSEASPVGAARGPGAAARRTRRGPHRPQRPRCAGHRRRHAPRRLFRRARGPPHGVQPVALRRARDRRGGRL